MPCYADHTHVLVIPDIVKYDTNRFRHDKIIIEIFQWQILQDPLFSFQTFSQSAVDITVESWNPLLQNTMGQREDLSFYDVKLANLAYCSGNGCYFYLFSSHFHLIH